LRFVWGSVSSSYSWYVPSEGRKEGRKEGGKEGWNVKEGK
jgi:hypothetical protein